MCACVVCFVLNVYFKAFLGIICSFMKHKSVLSCLIVIREVKIPYILREIEKKVTFVW